MPDLDLDRVFDQLVADVERDSRVPGANRARSTARTHRTRIAGALTALALLGVGVVTELGDRGGQAPAPVGPTDQRESTDGFVGDPGTVLPTTPIDGLWRSRPLAPREAADLLAASGATDVLARWEGGLPPARTRLALAAATVRGYGLFLGTADDPWLWRLDWGFPQRHGDDVLLKRRYGDAGEALLHPTVTGRRLTLDLVSSTYPDRRGVTGADRVRAMYTALAFERFYGIGP